MKNIKIITLVISAASFFSGCNKDLLETIPTDRLSVAIYWQTENDAIYAANAVYRHLESPERFTIWDGMSDIGHMNVAHGDPFLIEMGIHDPTFGQIQSEWKSYYSGICAANIFLENIDRVKTVNQVLIDRLKGEVKTLRAYFYMKLAALYGDVSLVTTSISLNEGKNLTREPVWDFISKEFKEAAGFLPNTQTEKGRITKGAALALKARAALYAGRYVEAAEAARQVMDLNVYSLYPSYQNLFTYAAQNNQEIILDKQFAKGIYENNIFTLVTPSSIWPVNNPNFVVPTKQAVDAYQMNNGKSITDTTSGFDPYNPYSNRDPRLRYSICVPGDVLPNGQIYNSLPNSGTGDAVRSSMTATYTGFNVKKYLNKEDLNTPNNCGINIILMRYAELLLIYAEAKIELNQIDQSVLDAINEVRQRPDVNMPPISNTSQAELRNIVRNERLVELAFEGLRFFDIRRWRIAENVMPGIIYGMTYSDQNGKLVTISQPLFNKKFNNPRDYLWPIPQKEIDLNPSLNQNLYW